MKPGIRKVLLQGIKASFDEASYSKAVETLKTRIAQGEVYQANLAIQFKTETQASPFDLL